jgi:hypothetical protein
MFDNLTFPDKYLMFYHVSQRYIDMNWTCDGIQFSVDNPYLVLLTVADIDTLSIENCEVKIRKVCKYKLKVI